MAFFLFFAFLTFRKSRQGTCAENRWKWGAMMELPGIHLRWHSAALSISCIWSVWSEHGILHCCRRIKSCAVHPARISVEHIVAQLQDITHQDHQLIEFITRNTQVSKHFETKSTPYVPTPILKEITPIHLLLSFYSPFSTVGSCAQYESRRPVCEPQAPQPWPAA